MTPRPKPTTVTDQPLLQALRTALFASQAGATVTELVQAIKDSGIDTDRDAVNGALLGLLLSKRAVKITDGDWPKYKVTQ